MTEAKKRPSKARPAVDELQEFVLGDAPGHLLRRAHQRSEELFTAAVGADGLTRQQVAVLVTACQNPATSQADLVARTGIDKNTMAEMVKRLTERGLLQRKRGELDARTNMVSATPAGIRLLRKALPNVQRVQKQILDPLPAELRPVFQHCLRLIIGLEDGAE